MVGLNMDVAPRDRVLKLMEEKDKIEREIQEATAVLEANNVRMSDPLVDAEGFPRNDIDVYQVRHARHRILCLQNDHKKLMEKIEQGLGEVHSYYLAPNYTPYNEPDNGSDNGEAAAVWEPEASNENANMEGMTFTVLECFAVIGFVQMGSPADIAGLMEYDQVLQFGSVTMDNFKDITQLHDIVSHSVGQAIQVRVKRDNNVLNFTVVPKPWAQPGLLGCQMRRQLSIQVRL